MLQRTRRPAGMGLGELGCLTMCFVVSLLGSLLLVVAAKEQPKVRVEEFYFSKSGSTALAQSEYVWPEDSDIDAVAVVDTSGYQGERKLDLYVVVFDEEGQVLAKFKGRHQLKAGLHTLSVPAALSTLAVFGARQFTARVEASLKGGGAASASCELSVEGPDPPEVDFVDLILYNPADGKDSQTFSPGSSFVFEAVFDIRENPGKVKPIAMVYCAMEEDNYLVDPALDYQPYYEQWDQIRLDQTGGEFRLRAAGRMPRYFAEAWEHRHPVRAYLYLDFGSGVRFNDYARAEVLDQFPGEARRSDDLEARLVGLDRAYKWEIRRIRPALD